MSFTPAQLWEFSERELVRRKRLYERWLGEGRIKLQQVEYEVEALTEIANILRDRAQGKLPL